MARKWAIVVFVLLACGPLWAAEKIVTLTIEDEAGVDRVNEPITMGVPLPEGKVRNVALLKLTDANGNAVPFGATEVAKWPGKRSVKWVHLTWNQSVRAKQKATVSLVLLAKPPALVAGPLRLNAKKRGNTVTVTNRYVKFTVLGARFDGFHQAWFDATGKGKFNDANVVVGLGRWIAEPGGSHVVNAPKKSVTLKNEHPKVTGATTAHSSVNDPKGKVEIEESGPGRVVVKATGRHMGPAGRVLDYIVRFYAYADSPVVRVSHTFVSKQGTRPADFNWMAALNFDVPTRLAGGTVTIGTEKQPISCPAPGSIHQFTSDNYTIRRPRTSEPIMGRGKTTKPITTGWIDVRKGKLGLAAGIKWFWQMHPNKLSVERDGRLRIGLYPLGSRPLEVYMGQSRTHYMTFLFHDGKATPKRLNEFFAATQRPLRAWAPAKYYTRDTHCLGYAVENNRKLFGADWPKVERWNQVQLRSIQMLLEKRDGNTYGPKDHRVTRDSYGIYAWGDRFHWAWGSFGQSPLRSHQWRQSWAGNYYDYPNSMLMAFLRTGEKTFLEWFFPGALHIGDVHTCNWHATRPDLAGACRYCPPRNFVSTDNGRVYVSNEFNHWKSQSVFAHWYLTGDLRSLDHIRLLMNVAYRNRDADRGWAARGIGSQMIGLWNAYELTLEEKYFDRLKGLASRAMAQFRRGRYNKGGFHDGIANEGLCHYYWLSGDKAVIDTFLAGYPKNRGRNRYPNMALGAAMTYRVTGDERFRDWAWQALARQRPHHRVHGPGCQFRGTHFALFFLSNASEGWRIAPRRQ